jgi:hypothetical protein
MKKLLLATAFCVAGCTTPQLTAQKVDLVHGDAAQLAQCSVDLMRVQRMRPHLVETVSAPRVTLESGRGNWLEIGPTIWVADFEQINGVTRVTTAADHPLSERDGIVAFDNALGACAAMQANARS